MPNPVDERERHAYLSNLYVQPAARGGIGTRLLEAALDWAGANGVDRVVLWPSERSVTLYRRHGFVADGGVMELTVPMNRPHPLDDLPLDVVVDRRLRRRILCAPA